MHELKAPKIAVADLMRLSTSDSEVNELFIIDLRYLNSLVKSMKPSPSTWNLSVLYSSYSLRGLGQYIASVFEAVVPRPTCISRPNFRK